MKWRSSVILLRPGLKKPNNTSVGRGAIWRVVEGIVRIGEKYNTLPGITVTQSWNGLV